jgi:tetratricopeptide (TPR) repeat protein
VRAVVLDGAGYLAMEQGDLDEATELLEASLVCAKEVGATGAAALAAAHVSAVRVVSHGMEGALTAAEEGLALAREADDDFALAIALNCLAVALSAAGEHDRAKGLYEESLEVRRRLGDNSRIALALCNLGWRAFEGGDFVRATVLFGEAAEISTAIGDKRQIRAALGGLGWIAYREQRWQEADSLTRESLRLARELGMKPAYLDSIFCLAAISVATGDTSRAARLAGAAELHYSRLGGSINLYDDAVYRTIVESVKTACDTDTWVRASAETRAMSLDEAADYALS